MTGDRLFGSSGVFQWCLEYSLFSLGFFAFPARCHSDGCSGRSEVGGRQQRSHGEDIKLLFHSLLRKCQKVDERWTAVRLQKCDPYNNYMSWNQWLFPFILQQTKSAFYLQKSAFYLQKLQFTDTEGRKPKTNTRAMPLLEWMKLPYTESDRWSISIHIVYSDCQQLYRVSGRGLLHPLLPDPF